MWIQCIVLWRSIGVIYIIYEMYDNYFSMVMAIYFLKPLKF